MRNILLNVSKFTRPHVKWRTSNTIPPTRTAERERKERVSRWALCLFVLGLLSSVQVAQAQNVVVTPGAGQIQLGTPVNFTFTINNPSGGVGVKSLNVQFLQSASQTPSASTPWCGFQVSSGNLQTYNADGSLNYTLLPPAQITTAAERTNSFCSVAAETQIQLSSNSNGTQVTAVVPITFLAIPASNYDLYLTETYYASSGTATAPTIDAGTYPIFAPQATVVTVSPGPTTLSLNNSTVFTFALSLPSYASAINNISVQFLQSGASAGSGPAWCGFQIGTNFVQTQNADGSLNYKMMPPSLTSTQTQRSNSYCAVGLENQIQLSFASSTLVAIVPITFTIQPAQNYSLWLGGNIQASFGAVNIAPVNVGVYPFPSSATTISSTSVTPTQAAITFMPPSSASTCTVAVTQTGSTTLVHDTDPSMFPNADSANVGGRTVVNADGSRTVVIGKRTAEYSPLATSSLPFKKVSRALQAVTAHSVSINCGGSIATTTFTTANAMPGISYTDPIPTDPNVPGQYGYPTLSWTNRSEAVVDPQSGMRIGHVTMPEDFKASTTGTFGSASGSTTSVFLPANMWQNAVANNLAWTSALNMTVKDAAWPLPGVIYLPPHIASFRPASLSLSCPTCSNTIVTACLTADGVNCAVDVNSAGDTNLAVDPNTGKRGILGSTWTCSASSCTLFGESRWADATSMLRAWHPRYADVSSSADLSVTPSFSMENVKNRNSQVTCSGTAVTWTDGVYFSAAWSAGTPVTINGTANTVSSVIDHQHMTVNSACTTANPVALVANTFGLLIKSPVPVTVQGTPTWSANLDDTLGNSWDEAGSIEDQAHCSAVGVSVTINSQSVPGWHCKFGWNAYWVAKDGSASLPMGYIQPPGGGAAWLRRYCTALMWDNSPNAGNDGNTLYCIGLSAPDGSNKHVIIKMTFQGNHQSLFDKKFPSSLVTDANLPYCSGPGTPDCWNVGTSALPLTANGVSQPTIEDAVAALAPAAWANSYFGLNPGVGWRSSFDRIGQDYIGFGLVEEQNSIGFSGLIRLSSDRTSAAVVAAQPSWTDNGTTGAPRWAGLHNTNPSYWGGTKFDFNTTYLRIGYGTGPYYSTINSISTASSANCPSGVSGVCQQVVVKGQPGATDHHLTTANPPVFEPINDAKTQNPGSAYLQDLAVNDVLCVSVNNVYGGGAGCADGYIPYNLAEYFKIVSIDTTSAAPSVKLVVQSRYLGSNPAGTATWLAGQLMYVMPSDCSSANVGEGGCDVLKRHVFDYAIPVYEDSPQQAPATHGFTMADPVASQYAAANVGNSPQCSTGNPYTASVSGAVNFSQTLTSPTAYSCPDIVTAFSSVAGFGVPNIVDSHAGAFHLPLAQGIEKTWFFDGRPFLGVVNSGTYAAPTRVTGTNTVYSMPNSQYEMTADGYKRQPGFGYCGMQPLREVKTINDSTPYSYCIANYAGDCGVASSTAGQSYLACPSVTADPAVNTQANPQVACSFPGIAGRDPELRDACFGLAGNTHMYLTQVRYANQTNGVLSPLPTTGVSTQLTRPVTHGFNMYRATDPFWNPHTTPDGKVLLFQAPFMNGMSTQILMAALPPFPDTTNDSTVRNDFQSIPVTLTPPTGTTSVKIQFGYDSNFYCTTRPEACEARTATVAAEIVPASPSQVPPFYYASEPSTPAGVACTNGSCPTINLPGISQRVLFYQPIYTTSSGTQTGPVQVAVIP